MFAARAHDTPDANAERYELDVVPTAAYADVTAADGLHLRIGYQSVVLGRFDVINPSDMLSVYDLRNGLTTMPEANEIGQPAVRADWDIRSWLELTAIALPFFEPHLIHAVDGDYALAPITKLQNFGFDPALLRTTLSRSGQAQLTDSAFYAFAPAPSFTHPQAALRLNAHGAPGELGFTAGIAREHLPVPRYSDAFLQAVDNGTLASSLQQHPFAFDYNPYELLSVDGATAIGPVQVGAELAYMFNRTFLSSLNFTPDMNTPRSQQLQTAQRTDLAHAGVRAEYAEGEWLVVLEAAIERAMQLPAAGRRYAFFLESRWWLSSVGFIAFSPGNLGLTLEAGAALLNGPTYMLMPRVEQRLLTGFFAEAGAYFVGGKRYPQGDPRVTIGDIYHTINQAYVGLRWQP
jgi:hypothetical protein